MSCNLACVSFMEIRMVVHGCLIQWLRHSLKYWYPTSENLGLSLALLQVQLPANVYCGKQKVMTQTFGHLLPRRDIKPEFRTPWLQPDSATVLTVIWKETS